MLRDVEEPRTNRLQCSETCVLNGDLSESASMHESQGDTPNAADSDTGLIASGRFGATTGLVYQAGRPEKRLWKPTLTRQVLREDAAR